MDNFDVKTNLQILIAENEMEQDAFICLDKEAGFYASVTKSIRIDNLNLSVRTAVFGYGSFDSFEPDWSGTIIYELSETDPEKYLYYEQDGVRISIHNYLSAMEYANAQKHNCA